MLCNHLDPAAETNQLIFCLLYISALIGFRPPPMPVILKISTLATLPSSASTLVGPRLRLKAGV